MSKNTHLPLFVDMSGKKVLVYGAGNIARRRITTLVDFDADVTVVAPDVRPEVMESEVFSKVTYINKAYEPGEIADGRMGKPFMVLSATNDKSVNSAVYEEAKAAGFIANNASDQTQCDFMFPAIIRKDDMVIGVTSGGRDHTGTRKFAAQLREM